MYTRNAIPVASRIQDRAALHSALAVSIAEAELSARDLLKRLKKAHRSGAPSLSLDVRFVDDLVARLGAKRRSVIRKTIAAAAQGGEP